MMNKGLLLLLLTIFFLFPNLKKTSQNSYLIDGSKGANSIDFVEVLDLKIGDVLTGKTRIDNNVMHKFKLRVKAIEHRGGDEYNILTIIESDFLEETGVAAGMSGSPVYFNGKIVGAVANTYSFLKKPMAGITPIKSMLKIIDFQGKENRDIFTPPLFNKSLRILDLAPSLKKDIHSFIDAFTPNKKSESDLFLNFSKPNNHDVIVAPKSIPLPFSVSGLFPYDLNRLGNFKKNLGIPNAIFIPSGVATDFSKNKKSNLAKNENEKLVAGDYVGINLVRGDLNISAFGTVTYIKGDTILAFGHSLGRFGAINLPLYKAKVETFVPLQTLSFKVGSLVKEIGSLTEDRQWGVLGKIGKPAKYIPVIFDLKNQLQNKQYKFEVTDSPFFFPGLVSSLITEIFFNYQSGNYPGTLRYRIQIDTNIPLEKNSKKNPKNLSAKYKSIIVNNEVSSQNSSLEIFTSISYINSAIHTVMNNKFFPVKITKVHLSVEMTPTINYQWIDSVQAEKKIYEPGEVVNFKVEFKQYRQPSRSEKFSFTLPKNLTEGKHDLVIGSEIIRWLFTYLPIVERKGINTIYDLIKFYQQVPRNNYISMWMTTKDTSLVIREEIYHRLPANQRKLLWESLQSKKDYFNDIIYKDVVQPGMVYGLLPLVIEVRKNLNNNTKKK